MRFEEKEERKGLKDAKSCFVNHNFFLVVNAILILILGNQRRKKTCQNAVTKTIQRAFKREKANCHPEERLLKKKIKKQLVFFSYRSRLDHFL